MIELFDIVASLRGTTKPFEDAVSRATIGVQNLVKEIDKAENKPINLSKTKKELDDVQKKLEKLAQTKTAPTISNYRDLDNEEKKITKTVEREANNQKLAKQIAGKQAYEEQVKLNTKLVDSTVATTKKITRAEADAWKELIAYDKKIEEATLRTNAVLKESSKSLANYQIREAKRANDEQIKLLKQNPPGGGGGGSNLGGAFGGSFLGTLAGGATTQILSELQQIPGMAINAGKSILDLAKNSSDYGRAIAAAELKTGMTAETLSTLRYAAELSGRDFKDLTMPIAQFTHQLEIAAKGSIEAREKMRALGVTNFTDLDGSLKQVITKINSLPEGFERSAAAADAFGIRQGKEMVPVLDKLGRGLDATAKEAKRLGLVLSEDQVRAAAQFGRSYETVSSQLTALAAQFGIEMGKGIVGDIDNFSDVLSRNQDKAKKWGQYTGDTFSGLITTSHKLSDALHGIALGLDDVFRQRKGTTSDFGGGLLEGLWSAINPFASVGEAKRKGDADKWKNVSIFKDGDLQQIKHLRKSQGSSYTDEFGANKAIKDAQEQNKADLAKQQDTYRIAEAILGNHLDLTVQQQLGSFKALNALKQSNLQVEYNLQISGYNKEIAAAKGDTEAIVDLTKKKNEALSKLTADYRVNEQNAQKQIQQYEYQIQEQRRQSAIEFKSLQIREESTALDKQTFNIERALALQGDTYKTGYNDLIKTTIESNDRVSQLTRESYSKQLNNQALTNEQRTNLEKQMRLDLEDLNEKSSRRIIEIQNRQYKAQLDQIDRFSDAFQRKLGGISNSFQTIGGALNPQNIDKGFVKNLGGTLFGGDIDEFIKKEQDKIKAHTEFRQKIVQTIPSLTNLSQINDAKQVFADSGIAIELAEQKLKFLDKGYSDFSKTLYRTIKGYDEGTVSLRAFQKIQLELFDKQTLVRAAQYDEQIDSINQKIEDAVKAGNTDDRLKFTQQRTQIVDEKTLYLFDQGNKKAEQYRQTLDGLGESLRKLRSGEGDKKLGELFYSEKLQDRISQLTEIKRLQYDLANSPYIDSLVIEKAHLQDILDLRYKETDAIIRTNHAQSQLTQKWTVSHAQINARVMEVLASTKGLTEIFGDIKVNAIEGAFNAIDDGAHALIKSLGLAETTFGHLIESMLADLAKLALNQVFKQLFGGETEKGSSGGSWWKALLKIGTTVASAFAGGGGGVNYDASSAASSPFGTAGFGFASGGLIGGTGTGTSDSNLAAVSKGEFVNQAASVSYYGAGFFEALNRKMIPKNLFNVPHFAGGGMGSGAYTMPMATPSSNSVSNVYNVTMQINTPNAASFRQSESQITNSIKNKLIASDRRG